MSLDVSFYAQNTPKAVDGHTPSKPAGELTALPAYTDLGAETTVMEKDRDRKKEGSKT